MAKQLTLKSVLLKAGDSDHPNWDSEEHVEVMEAYDPDPPAKKQESLTFEIMCYKVTF